MKMYDVKGVAELFGVSDRTVWNCVDRREFPKPIRIGRLCRWSEDMLQSWARSESARVNPDLSIGEPPSAMIKKAEAYRRPGRPRDSARK